MYQARLANALGKAAKEINDPIRPVDIFSAAGAYFMVVMSIISVPGVFVAGIALMAVIFASSSYGWSDSVIFHLMKMAVLCVLLVFTLLGIWAGSKYVKDRFTFDGKGVAITAGIFCLLTSFGMSALFSGFLWNDLTLLGYLLSAAIFSVMYSIPFFLLTWVSLSKVVK